MRTHASRGARVKGRRRWVSITGALLLAACSAAGTRPGGFATAHDLPVAPRQPAGVVVDPSPELPAAEETHDQGSPLVALKPPLPEKAARGTVAAFFRAIVTEDIDALSELLTQDANAMSSARTTSTAVIDHWRGRLHHFRYRALASETLYQNVDIELYRYADLETLLPGRPLRPTEMVPSDLLLKVPMLIVRAGNERIFGDEMTFLLRRDDDRFRVRQIIEDFQVP